MYKIIFFLFAVAVCGVSCRDIKKLDSLPGPTIEQFIDCICYAKTGWWDINLCGRRSITLAFWRTASTEEDKNCVLNIIESYKEQFGEMDCSLEGIPTVIFNQFQSCLSHVIKTKGSGRYKRSKLPHGQTTFKQNVNGNYNDVSQNEYTGGARGCCRSCSRRC